MIQFPEDFLWGAATSAYQVEGNNLNSDWWEWERKVGLKEFSGQACRGYELYETDFELAHELNHNAHRLSIEWSRVEPQEGRFLEKEIEHYRKVILALKERNLEPIVTLHHFTNPIWFAKLGGWQSKFAKKYFLRFVERMVEELADKVRFWVTINEPMVYVYHGYILGVWPPQEKSFLKAGKVTQNLMETHIETYKLIHSICKKRNFISPSVSIAQNMQAFAPCSPSLKNKLAIILRQRYYNFELLRRLAQNKALDFIGLNYYSRQLVDIESWGWRQLLLKTCQKNHSRLRKNSLGWDIYPEGFYKLLLKLKKFNLPVFILENGICTDDDNLRWDFIKEHLEKLNLALAEGLLVLGYLYWSLVDNFEWDKGFAPRFGLVEVDYSTYQRKIRESARKFALVCKTRTLV